MKKTVIFDLDGTLLNTVEDIAAATNHALRMYGYPEHPTGTIRTFIGNGINKLFERALPEGHKGMDEVLKIRKAFIPYYNEHGTEKTVPFNGICRLLDRLQRKGIMISVASNKYQEATESLVRHFFPDIRFSAILGQREGIPVKPDPAIVHEICRISGISDMSDVLYVGDSGVDMETAANCGAETVAVTWGCKTREFLASYSPAHIVDDASEIYSIATGESAAADITLSGMQDTVDGWIRKYGVRYFSELTNMAVLTEEVGELARVMARRYGDQSFKDGEKDNLSDELADIMWVIACIANQTGTDLTEAFAENIRKKTQRDSTRHLSNTKLQSDTE